MIPKIIHYCWFGEKALPESVKQYIEGWRAICKDYQIVEWNEKNFDISISRYCREAYESRKWAFVSDYARLYALNKMGGIYLDTDVEVKKSFDPLLNNIGFIGFESKTQIGTGIIAAQKNSGWLNALLEDYEKRSFLIDGKVDTTTNVEVITEYLRQECGLVLNGEKQVLKNGVLVLPFEYLCAKSLRSGKINCTDNTYSVHNFSASWMDTEDYNQLTGTIHFYNVIKAKTGEKLPESMVYLFAKIISAYHNGGVVGLCKRVKKRMDRNMR